LVLATDKPFKELLRKSWISDRV